MSIGSGTLDLTQDNENNHHLAIPEVLEGRCVVL